MKSLLIKLTLGLSEQDISPQESIHVNEFLTKKYLTYKDKIYKFNSKFRAGTLGLVQNGTAYLNVIGENVRDLYIGDGDLGTAKEGDLIIAQRLLGVRGTPSAKVVEIVGRAVSYGVAYIIQKENSRALVDLKTDFAIGVQLSDAELNSYEIGDVFKINNQDNVVMEKLGNLSDPLVDEKIVLAQFNKHDEFEPEVLEIASSFKPVDASKYPKRKDLRSLAFCTIDPVTAKDYDDAICWDDEKSTLYVAIADVSEYVEPFGALDNEAIYRSFSIYLPHRSIPMLPRQLSETLCSLQPHVDRLAYVFEMKLDLETLEVTKATVYEALIHSKRRFNYEEIDLFFEGKLEAKNSDEEEIFNYITKLKPITDRLKHKRLKVGYDFRSNELEMFIDENSNITHTTYAEETPSHALIEDCMLLANKAAASQFERGIFRIHEPPNQTKLQILYQELAGIGMHIDIKTTIKETITDIQKQAREMDLESEVDTLIIRSQMQARYAPLNSGHFGLGFDAYTHFTSPIRRYSDLIVHRLLKAIHNNDTQEGSYVLRNIEALSMTISEKEREASTIENEFMARKFARWANEHIGESFKARINATEPEVKAELHDEIMGARLNIISTERVVLFEDIEAKIERVDIAKAKIFASVIKNDE
ncbi:MAG: VacB/RNase II family 3'-5' exoribonuclease [Epsilonproteobacteria bacterium]|nr:VacB/RNase II family 3'-5' exoribonuclease [Campylobacterota bacterium]OIO16669.1 MAG: exoribonuclease II [Helicobacteraceae bacterium CG1_02_36_14]PIP09819.1 MAG: exoribonuclease II [Sulfurimonas sp. CG23_combo_of_CG06-09_8_20_14_all_36_33]PIS24034.1 MAG: exoribonuclease II [Sulfurimonas sp. CG08_land_8_20_14_0_20_36_33]PIU35518.1 MAG: exoribonuclease II [Sulfurimonas sp. CG07_land_8_20_14_0_80_36_56]PIV05439.1 MAG: exoribonuclease II [Sulfurimonas sp. CG03_land_8_20_14_0_80_36_25]PIV3708